MTRPSSLAGAALLAALLPITACDVEPDPEPAPGEQEAVVEPRTAEAGADRVIPVERSGVRGSAGLERDGQDAVIRLRLEGLEPGASYSAAVHEGRCAAGGALTLPIGRITAAADSAGSTRMRVSADQLPEAELFIQVYGPGDRPVACADIAADDNGPSL